MRFTTIILGICTLAMAIPEPDASPNAASLPAANVVAIFSESTLQGRGDDGGINIEGNGVSVKCDNDGNCTCNGKKCPGSNNVDGSSLGLSCTWGPNQIGMPCICTSTCDEATGNGQTTSKDGTSTSTSTSSGYAVPTAKTGEFAVVGLAGLLGAAMAL